MKNLTVALGGQRYRVERPWGDLPAGSGKVSDVAVDRRGHVFALLRHDCHVSTGATVIELDPYGNRLASWGEEIADAHMIAIAPDGGLVVVDRDAHEIVFFDRHGRRTGGLGKRHAPGEPFNHPSDVAFLADGRIAVADGYGNARVHLFSAEGAPVAAWGRLGVAPGEFVTPHAVWPFGDDKLAVADRENNRVQIFALDGTLIDVWTGFFRPLDIWGDDRGRLYITDQVPSLWLIGSDGARLGRCRPTLNGPHGVSGHDESGLLYLAETNPSRLTRLVPV